MAKKLKEWFDRDCALRIGEAIRGQHRTFDLEGFVDEVDSRVPPLELKDRVLVMSTALAERLPRSYPKAAAVLEFDWARRYPATRGCSPRAIG